MQKSPLSARPLAKPILARGPLRSIATLGDAVAALQSDLPQRLRTSSRWVRTSQMLLLAVQTGSPEDLDAFERQLLLSIRLEGW